MYTDLIRTLREMSRNEALAIVSKRQLRLRLRHWQRAQKIMNTHTRHQINSAKTRQK